MPFSRPTLARLISRARADIEAAFQNGAAFVIGTVEYVFASVVAGLAHGLYGFLSFISKQIIPTTATDSAFLDEHARFWLQGGRHDATYATFPILVNGHSASIPALRTFTTVDGREYRTAVQIDFDANAFSIPQQVDVTAVVAGAAGNVLPGTVLTIASPIVGITPSATVVVSGTNAVGGAEDRESDPQLLQRILDRVQTPPSGGGPGDYEDWAKEVNGVTRAWQQPLAMGPSTVRVLFVRDEFDNAGNFVQTVFPDNTQIAEVAAHIAEEAPVISILTVDAPDPLNVPFSIQLSPNNATTRAAVTAAIDDLILRDAQPGGTLLLSHIREAVSSVIAEEDSIIIAPAANVPSTLVQLHVRSNPITFANIP